MHTMPIASAMTLAEHVAIKMREPVMLWGPPGVAKSEGVAQLAKKLDAVLVDVRLSQYDSVDLRGFPGVAKDTGQTVWHPPSTLPFVGNDAFPDDKLIILFFDELNSASPAVLAPAYQIINDHRCGEHVFKDNVRIICAGNRETDRGVTTRMPLPLANRMTHAEVGPDVDGWCAWAQKEGLPPVGIAFIRFRKPLLMTFDPSKPDKAFATPRTVAKAMRYYASDMPEEVKMAAMAGAVGDGWAAEFWGFVDVWSKIVTIEQIIRDPEGTPVPEAKEMGARYATVVSVSGAMKKDKTLKPLYTYLKRFEPEFVVLAMMMAFRRVGPELTHTPEFMDYAKKYSAMWSPDKD